MNSISSPEPFQWQRNSSSDCIRHEENSESLNAVDIHHRFFCDFKVCYLSARSPWSDPGNFGWQTWIRNLHCIATYSLYMQWSTPKSASPPLDGSQKCIDLRFPNCGPRADKIPQRKELLTKRNSLHVKLSTVIRDLIWRFICVILNWYGAARRLVFRTLFKFGPVQLVTHCLLSPWL